MKKMISCIIFFLVVPYLSPCAAAQTWTEDFDMICSQAEVADSLSAEKLKELVLASDRLLAVIEASNDPQKKIFIFRLKKCRNLFVYVLDLGDAKERPAPR